jgi:hypothetical protein
MRPIGLTRNAMKHNKTVVACGSVIAAALLAEPTSHASAPPGHYTVSNGTVVDTMTSLTWQQTVSTSQYTQAQAIAYCVGLSSTGPRWRVPTFRELLTIVDFSVAQPGPTIDTAAFPGTPASYFWTATPYAGASNNAWVVLFSGGFTTNQAASNTNYVRCVH